MVRPLFTRPRIRPVMQLRPVHIGNQPVVSLVPPKLNPIYKPGGYVYNKPLPANVPPTIPSKPWQHQGWNMFKLESDKRPFIPSTPLPDTNNNAQDHNLFLSPVPTNSPTAFPIIPSTGVQSRPTFEVQPVQHILPHIPLHPVVPLHSSIPAVPIPPPVHTVNLQPTLPLPPPIQSPIPLPLQPSVSVQHPMPVQTVPAHHSVHSVPIHTPVPPNFNTVLQNTPLVPLHFLSGKYSIPFPDLGVLPLGSSVPVQLSAQNPQFIHKTSILPAQSSVPISFTPQQTHIIQKTPIFAVSTPSVHLTPEEVHRPPVVEPPVVQKFVPEIHHHDMPKPQVYLGEPQFLNKIPDSNSLGDGFTPVENHLQHNMHISVNPQDQSMSNILHQIPSQQHNYQYFLQNFSPNNAQQYQDSEEHSQGQIQQQGYEESSGFFQPGQTDLQIPDYLPEHPHFKQLQQYQGNSLNANER